jgi:divalent metal cation (Fe/Co/Zn/Cd) transporter
MDAQFTRTEINHYRRILQGENSAQKVLDTLENYNGRFCDSLDELLSEVSGLRKTHEIKHLQQATLKTLRNEVCGHDHFRTQFQECQENLQSTPLLTGLIASLVGLATAHKLPHDPAIATIVVLYILKIGLNIFCEYTETSAQPPATDPESRRIPHD